jgi:spore germination protein GerM
MSSTGNPSHLATDVTEQGGVRGWLASLSLRDRLIYGTLLSVMLLIIGIYMVLAAQLLLSGGHNAMGAPLDMTTTPTSTQVALVETSTPTRTPTPAASEAATRTPTPAPTDTPQASAPTPTGAPPQAGAPTTSRLLKLYFTDATGTLLVPIHRQFPVPSGQVGYVVVRELIAGPQPGSGLNSPVAASVGLREVRIADDGTAMVDFDNPPDSEQALEVIALSLTELDEVQRVEFQVNGDPLARDGEEVALRRVPINSDNPQNLPTSYDSGTRFLPLYFLYNDYYVRVTRLVPRTPSVANATVEHLLKGPGNYSNLLTSPIPPDTRLYGVSIADGNRAVVHLSASFADAADRDAALNALVLSVTALTNPETGQRYFEEVEVLVEGQGLAHYWGNGYNNYFMRPTVNRE